jgi:hypothetical protein
MTTPPQHRDDCGCLGCLLVRAGVCLNCAAEIQAKVRGASPRGPYVRRKLVPCSGACREALEHVLAEPKENGTKIRPDPQDYEAVECEYGRLPETATIAQVAHHYRLAQAAKLFRLYGQNKQSGRGRSQ